MLDKKLLNELVKDCITYKLTESEALQYIELRYGKKISVRSYKRRKAFVKSDTSTQLWLNHFTRVGFVKSHQGHLNSINKIRDELMHQLEKEISNKNNRDEDKILKIIDRIMEATKLLVGLDMGSPIIAEIKAKLEQKLPENPRAIETDKKKKKKRIQQQC
jgi:hypothetical protein